MTSLENNLGHDIAAFVAKATEEAELAFQVFRETGTITANGTVGFIERIPGENKLVSINYAGPFAGQRALKPAVFGLDGTVYAGEGRGSGSGRYNKIFEQHPHITTVSHVHSPYLGAWAQTHRTLPIRYVPVQRYLLTRELPVYIDRRQPEQEYILERLRIDAHTTAILEANGGSTVWGTAGLRKTAEFIVILEEGARLQHLAEALGGSRDFGPGVLAQQFKMSGLTEQARTLGFLPPIAN
ncbi:MAG TPA: class II aldolase/adducin family protein [Polyangiaceae bacterium]|nr:class II aldolase/adducin family protein [Polyangiaceae bacterium]